MSRAPAGGIRGCRVAAPKRRTTSARATRARAGLGPAWQPHRAQPHRAVAQRAVLGAHGGYKWQPTCVGAGRRDEVDHQGGSDKVDDLQGSNRRRSTVSPIGRCAHARVSARSLCSCAAPWLGVAACAWGGGALASRAGGCVAPPRAADSGRGSPAYLKLFVHHDRRRVPARPEL